MFYGFVVNKESESESESTTDLKRAHSSFSSDSVSVFSICYAVL